MVSGGSKLINVCLFSWGVKESEVGKCGCLVSKAVRDELLTPLDVKIEIKIKNAFLRREQHYSPSHFLKRLLL